jgi:hypothetical protein
MNNGFLQAPTANLLNYQKYTSITFNLQTLIMIPDYVHLNPIALFYLFMVCLQTLPLHMMDTQWIGKHVHGSKL